MPFPAHIGTGLIVGAFESWVLDGSDPDALPDRKPMVGLQITITPSVAGGLIRNETDGTLVTVEPLKVTTNADGVLGYYEAEGDQGSWHTGVRAVSPLDDQLDPSGWTYRVEIRTAGNVRLTDFSITFPPDAVFDLAKEAPVPADPGTAVAEWARVRGQVVAEAEAAGAAQVALAEAARDQAEVFAATTVELQDEAIAQAISTTGSETRTQLNATFVASSSVYLRNYITPGATRAENRAAYQAAIDAAESAGAGLCYDGAVFEFEGAPVRSTADGFAHWATNEETHKVTHKTVGRGPLRIAGERTTVSRLNLDGDNPTLDLSGTTGGNGWWSAGIFVEPTAHDSSIIGGRIAGFMYAIVGGLIPYDLMPQDVRPTPQEVAVEANFPSLRNLTIDGLYSDDCWTAYQPLAVDGSTVRRVSGTYRRVTGSNATLAGADPHLIYLGGWSSGDTPAETWRWSKNIELDDCLSLGGQTRHAFRARSVKGLTVSRLRAVDTHGLFQFINCEDVQIGEGCRSDRDRLPSTDNVGSAHLYLCRRVKQAPLTIAFAEDVNASRGGGITACEDAYIDHITVIDNSPIATAGDMYAVQGVNPRSVVASPELIAAGATRSVGLTFTIASDQPGDAQSLVIAPRIRGNVTDGMRVNHAGVTIEYDPDLIDITGRKARLDVAGVRLINRHMSVDPQRDRRIVAWMMGEPLHHADSSAWSKTPTGVYRSFMVGSVSGDDKGRILAVSGNPVAVAYPLSNDIDATVSVKNGAAFGAGIALRAIDTANTLALIRKVDSVALIKRVANGTTNLATHATNIPSEAFAELRAVIVGDTIVGFLNGVQVISHTLTDGDETTFATGGAGLYAASSADIDTVAWEKPVFRSVN